jgi:YHYH protein
MKNQTTLRISIASLLAFAFIFTACKKEETTTTTTTTEEVPAVYQKVYGATDIYVDGDYIVIKTNDVPDHQSPYFLNTQWQNTMWVDDTRPGFQQAPASLIATTATTFRIPKNPAPASTHTALSAATIGVAINGVAFFNQYQAQNQLITTSSGEYLSFDLYGGHPTPTNEYHYHIEPNYLTATKGSDALMGFMLDGYPIYGPVENNVTLTSADLDTYHGHTTVTEDYPNGIYHYHITSDIPYINGAGYYGVQGTWSH